MPTDAAAAPPPSTSASPAEDRRRLVVVLARHVAVAPPGVDPVAFGAAALGDSYEVAADLVEVDATIAGPAELAGLLYPGASLYPATADLAELCGAATAAGYDQVVFLPGDVPDLPGLVVAKMFKALQRAAVCIAPERGGDGCLGLGASLPLADWVLLPPDLDTDPRRELYPLAPRRSQVATSPDWHRLRTSESCVRLDPALEGWDETRLLLAESGFRTL